MIAFMLTGLVAAILLVSLAAALSCAVAVVRVLVVAHVLVSEWPRAVARDRWGSALRRHW